MESCKPDDAIYEDVSIIVSGALQMSRLLVSIMDWTKISVGQMELKLEDMRVGDILRGVVRCLQHLDGHE
jgi:K+-sensing histidine kinase KdpD